MFYFLQTKATPGAGFGTQQIIILVAMVAVFYFFFIRPQQKRASNQKKFITDLGPGERIVTIAGIHGKINKINDDNTINIEVSPGSYLKIEKSAISMDWTTQLQKSLNTSVTVDKK